MVVSSTLLTEFSIRDFAKQKFCCSSTDKKISQAKIDDCHEGRREFTASIKKRQSGLEFNRFNEIKRLVKCWQVIKSSIQGIRGECDQGELIKV